MRWPWSRNPLSAPNVPPDWIPAERWLYWNAPRNAIAWRLDDGAVPLCYPLLASRPGLRELLRAQRIYLPCYWPELLTRSGVPERERQWAERLLPLPVDQRYAGGLSHEPTPEPAWLEIKNPKIQTKPNRIEDVKMVLNVPDLPENRGRKLLFIVSIELDRKDMPFQMIGKVLATMRQ